jgi:glycerol-3-phosphate dehydrogenase
MATRDLRALTARPFDVVIVGGGISGACAAHDAALRGLSVALVEASDFGGATSAASSKILHSGIRYLQQAEFGKVRESGRERCTLQRIAPHLTRWVPFLVPSFPGLLKGQIALRAAVTLHGWLTAGQDRTTADRAKRVPPSRFCGRPETLALAPILSSQPGLTGSCVVHEAHMHSSERMTLAFLMSAVQRGAVIANYVAAERLLTANGAVRGLTVRDGLGGDAFDIEAKVILNAAGPWIPAVAHAFGVPGLGPAITGFSKGIHLVTRPLVDDVALVLPTRQRQRHVIDRGGRHLFVIPWRGVSLIGTSNVPLAGGPDAVVATPDDITGLLRDLNDALPGADLATGDVRHAFAGVYPLTGDLVAPDVYQATGEYQVIDHARSGSHPGLVSMLGAKYTTARRLAEIAIDTAAARLGRPGLACRTADTPLAGGAIEDLEAFARAVHRRLDPQLSAPVVQHLLDHYGTDVDAVLAPVAGIDPTSRLSPARLSVAGEVAFAVTHELAVHLDDVVFRRTGLGTIGHPGREVLERAADIMGGLLGWDPGRKAAEIERVDARFPVR